MQVPEAAILETIAQLHLDAFKITLRDIGEIDVVQLHALSVAVGWPHRDSDWRVLLDLGQGIAAVDEIGRVVGTVMWQRYGAGFTMVGMLITSPRLQEHGAGRWLMERAHELNPGSAFGLTATHAARRLYRSMGYGHEQKILQCQGQVVGSPPSVRVEGTVRAMRAEDRERLLSLDRAATGCDRSAVFRRILPVSKGQVLVRNDEIVAFALCRRFGRERVIGPVIASAQEDAIAVCQPFVELHAGSFLRVDTPASHTAFVDFIVASGMQIYDSVTSMGLGRAPYAPVDPHGPRRMALASQALG